MRIVRPKSRRPRMLRFVLRFETRSPGGGGASSVFPIGACHSQTPKPLNSLTSDGGAGGILGLPHRCLPLSNSQTLKLFNFWTAFTPVTQYHSASLSITQHHSASLSITSGRVH